MTQFHSLLKRQLKRHFGDDAVIPEEWQGFLRDVDDAYRESDIDREMLERSLELSSQELLEANSQMRAVFQALPDLLFRIDGEGIILEYKAGNKEDFLVSPKEFLGKRIQDLPLGHIGDRFCEALEQVQKDRTMVSLEYSLLLQGQKCFYEARLTPLSDARQFIVIIRNLTARKEMEIALRQARDELEERIEQRTVALKQANERLAALYKVGQTITAPLQLNVVLNLIARSTAELLSSDTGVILLLDEAEGILTIEGAFGLSEQVVKGTRDRVGESIAGRVVQTGEPIIANDLIHDSRFSNPSAASERLLACASVPLIAGGKTIGTLDVHSKSNPYAFTEEHVRILGMLAGQAAIAIENARLYKELKLAHDELESRVEQRTAELMDANALLQQEIIERRRAEEALRNLNEELEIRVEDRTIELKEMNSALLESLDHLKRTQEQLVQSGKMAALGGLVAGIAHEINTPLGVSVTAASHLQDKTQEIDRRYWEHNMTRSALEAYFETAGEITGMLMSNLKRAAELIQGFKQVAVDQTSEEKRVFKLKEYLDDVLLSLRPRLKRTQSAITVTCSEDIEIESYPGAFSQIFTNFIMNSLIHGSTPESRLKIDIHAYEEPEGLRLRYSDDGKGMGPQECIHIFEPFYTSKRGQGGSGLGLHIVYNLVNQRLHGNISCESEPGKGTTFMIQLPIKTRL